MMTNTKRVEKMHERARQIKRARDKAINRMLGASSAILLVALIILAYTPAGGLHPIENMCKTGSTLLYEGGGGYVLVAVVSFMVAVVITVVCIRWNEKKNNKKRSQEKSEK